jgi:phage terminase small subunit
MTVVETWTLEEHHLRLLTLAGEAWDRCTQAREQLRRDGLTVTTRHGEVRTHPCVAIERDSRVAFARLLRELDLDVEAPEARRPPALRSIGARA